MLLFQNWLDTLRNAGQCGRVERDSLTKNQCNSACIAYVLNHKLQHQPDQMSSIPVVYVSLPPEDTALELCNLIFHALAHPIVEGEVAAVVNWLLRSIKQCGVEILIIDIDVENLTPEVFWLVHQICKLQIAVILSGTADLDTKIQEDEQLYRRFDNCYKFQNSQDRILPQYSNNPAQIEYSNLDLLVVDTNNQYCRPYLTPILDTYSRCMVGFYLTDSNLINS